MGRKRRKSSRSTRSQSVDMSTPESIEASMRAAAAAQCTHMKARAPAVRNVLTATDSLECRTCHDDFGGDVWLCTHCGIIACGRNEGSSHALTHLKEKGERHAVVVDLAGRVWCYACDDFVGDFSAGKLGRVKAVELGKIQECFFGLRKLEQRVKRKKLEEEKSRENDPLPPKQEKMPLRLLTNSSISRGLINLGNTCFFNSVMQCLTESQSLATHISDSSACGSMHACLESFLVSMRSTDSKNPSRNTRTRKPTPRAPSFNPGQLFAQISSIKPRFRSMQQQDAHELWRVVMEGLREECEGGHDASRRRDAVTFVSSWQQRDVLDWLSEIGVSVIITRASLIELVRSMRTKKSRKILKNVKGEEKKNLRRGVAALIASRLVEGDGVVDKVFKGTMESVVECSECSTLSKVPEDFFDISLGIPSPARSVSFDSCMSAFLEAELLDGDNKYACEHCAQSLSPDSNSDYNSDSDSMDNVPYVLTAATKRLVVTAAPKDLVVHLKRFAQTHTSLQKVSKHVDFPLEIDWGKYQSGSNIRYALYGVVEHMGGLSSGHYVAYVKKQETWVHFSDQRFSDVDVDKVLFAQAYLLFYERVD